MTGLYSRCISVVDQPLHFCRHRGKTHHRIMKYSQESARDGKEIDQKNIGQPEISYFSKRCGMVPRRFFYFFFRSHYLTPSTNSSVAVDRLSALSMITAVKAPLQERCETRSATVRLSALRHGTHGGVMVFFSWFQFSHPSRALSGFNTDNVRNTV